MCKRVTFSYDPERDSQIAMWLESMPSGERSALIRLAIREYLSSGVGLAELQASIAEIRDLLRSGAVMSTVSESGDSGQVERAKEKLSELGL